MKNTLIHELKLHTRYFYSVVDMSKPFEVRKNDRDYKKGDELLLKEFVPKGYFEEWEEEAYTGQICHRVITYVLKGGEYGLEKGYVILGLARK